MVWVFSPGWGERGISVEQEKPFPSQVIQEGHLDSRIFRAPSPNQCPQLPEACGVSNLGPSGLYALFHHLSRLALESLFISIQGKMRIIILKESVGFCTDPNSHEKVPSDPSEGVPGA